MLKRHWPWLVSVAAPAAASACLLLWVALAPQVWDSATTHPAVGDSCSELGNSREELFVAADRDGDGLLSALEYREGLAELERCRAELQRPR